jgi:hypothetical protein
VAGPPSPKKPAVPVPATVKMLLVAAGAAGTHNSNAAATPSPTLQTARRTRPLAEAWILIALSPFEPARAVGVGSANTSGSRGGPLIYPAVTVTGRWQGRPRHSAG